MVQVKVGAPPIARPPMVLRVGMSSREGRGPMPTPWSTQERSTMPTCSIRPESARGRRPRHTSMVSPDGPRSAVIGQRKGVHRVRLPSVPVGTLQSVRLRHAGRVLSLRAWSRRTQSGTPTEIWNRLLMGFPAGEALGGRDAVARAVAVVTFKEARAESARLRRSAKRPGRRNPRRRGFTPYCA